MTKRIFLIHQWTGSPYSDFIPWLKKELEKQKGFEVYAPEMPDTDNPKINDWVDHISKIVGKVDEHTYFVGHSIGCQAILRYLETVNGKIGGCVFVAGWFRLTPEAIPTESDKEIVKDWIYLPIDFKKIKRVAKSITAIFSDNDPYVSLENSAVFKSDLGARIVIEKNKGHFTSKEDGVTKVPEVKKELLEMIK